MINRTLGIKIPADLNFKKLKKIIRIINSPPPYIWFTSSSIIVRKKYNINIIILIKEIVQQTFHSLKNILNLRNIKYLNYLGFSPKFIFFGYILNTFTIKELINWKSIGVDSWEKIRTKIPDKISPYLHSLERKKWPRGCKDIIEILNNKQKLLHLVPNKWKYPFLIIDSPFNINQDYILKNEWVINSFLQDGLIIKPIYGNNSNNIFRLTLKEGSIITARIFTNNIQKKKVSNNDLILELIKIWEKFNLENFPFLVMPYINSNLNCTYSSESSVIRVITKKENFNSSINILDSWIEIPIYTKHVIYISNKYKGLMIKDDRIQDEIIRDIEKWNKFLTIKQSTSIQSCLSASIDMHKKLNNINTVAWDWISTSMGPKLLEGNALFGLQITQIFNELKTKISIDF